MRSPSRRIVVWPAGDFVEILVLGERESIAYVMALLLHTTEHWDGFEQVHVLVQGLEQIGISAKCSRLANHVEPDVEAMRMIGRIPVFATLGIEWREADRGAIGTW